MKVINIELAMDGRFLEGVAYTEIYPGMLAQRVLIEGKIEPHRVAYGPVVPLIVVENRFKGRDVNIAYIVDDIVYMRYCLPGDVFWARVDSSGDLESGMFVASKGNGSLTPVGVPPHTDKALVGTILSVGVPTNYPLNTVWCKIER